MNNAFEQISAETVKIQLETWNSKFIKRNWDVHEFIFEPPAAEAEIIELEKDIKIKLPCFFKKALVEISRHIEFRWFTPENFKFPTPFKSNFSGDLHWSIDSLKQLEESRKEWVRVCFPNSDDSYDAVWHNKLPFYEIGNGDYLALDLDPNYYEKIVYLSHDDGEGHGYFLAENFFDLLKRWIPLACTGGEDWQWLHFVSDKNSGINPNCKNAMAWKNLLEVNA